MKQILRKFWKNESGNFGVLGAIGASGVLAATALAVDTSSLYGKHASFQSSLDAAALAAATVEPSQYNIVASEIFNASIGLNGVDGVNVNVSRQGDILVGTASGTIDTFFGGMLMPSTVNISASASVGFSREVGGEDDLQEVVGTRACIIVLSERNQALHLNSNSSIIAPECEVHVHSRRQRSAVADSNQHDVSKFCLAASQLQNNNSGLGVELNCDVADDPYAGTLPTTVPNNCVSQPQNINGDTPQTFSPGRYCNGINVNGQADIHFEPGTYYISGRWNVNGGRWTGEGVTFVFGRNGNFQFNSNFGGMEMAAPTSGDFSNMFMVDIEGSGNFILNSDNELNITGSIYMPNRKVIYNSSSTTIGSAMNFVVGELTMNSRSSLNIIPANFMPKVPGEIYNESSGNGDGVSDGDGTDSVRVASSEGTPYLIR